MTDRGLPIVGGAPACPFVAFEVERDERSPKPDHRHRCYAEEAPAPRALAHQEAYCLSSAFAVCPTFQDWARREAARARAPERTTGPRVASTAADGPPRRNPPREWSAPPPWLEDEPAGGPPGSGGLSGSVADRLAAGESFAPSGLAAPDADRSRVDDGGGGRVPDRPATQRPARLAVPPPPEEDDEPPETWDDDEASDADDEEDLRPLERRPVGSRSPVPQHLGRIGSGGSRGDRPAADRPSVDRDRRRLTGPSWEPSHRLEAYPGLRARLDRSAISLPPVALGVVALTLAAAGLFALPTLLGIGGPDGGGATPTPTVAATATPEASAEPTPTPAPTATVYVVAPGDTMSKIATRFGIPLEALLAANPQIPDPDKIRIGDEVIIPIGPINEIPGASGTPEPSVIP